jgi:hypothetical protein
MTALALISLTVFAGLCERRRTLTWGVGGQLRKRTMTALSAGKEAIALAGGAERYVVLRADSRQCCCA